MKKDLIEAQKFSRSRLLSAFVGGAPGGKELEPAKPLRAVFAGIALTAMVLLAGVFAGLLKPGLPSGWQNNHLVVARDTGARYVSVQGVLHPVINTVSARMIIPPGEFKVISVDQSSLNGVAVGGTVGILGGPDSLPDETQLDGTNWQACSSDDYSEFWLGGAPRRAATNDEGTVVNHGGRTFVVSGGTAFEVAAGAEIPVLRAVGLDTAQQHPVQGNWIALFVAGATLEPLTVPGAGDPAPGIDLPVGAVLHETGSPDTNLYLLTAQGELAPLSQLAYKLYLLGDGAGKLGEPVEIGPAEIAELPTATPAAGKLWPESQLTPLRGDGSPCATLTGKASDQRTTLSARTEVVGGGTAKAGVLTHVPDGGGALVRPGVSGSLSIIDPIGIRYAVPGSIKVATQRLGYSAKDVTVVPAAWLQLLPAGPELTPEAAGATPTPTPTPAEQ